MNGVPFVTDPLAGLHAEIDATIGLMNASQELGLDVWCCAPEELAVVDGRVRAHAHKIRLRPRRPGIDHRWVVDPTWWDELEVGVVDAADFEVVAGSSVRWPSPHSSYAPRTPSACSHRSRWRRTVRSAT